MDISGDNRSMEISTTAITTFRKPEQLITLAFLAVLCVGGIVVFVASNQFPDEDAYITYVFSKSFLEGRGLTYNGIVTEGYTNLLSVLLTAFISLMTRIPVDVSGYLLSLLFTIATILGVFVLMSEQPLRPTPPYRIRLIAFFACVILLINPYFTYWAFSGMENSLYSFVLVISLLAFQGGSLKWALAAASILPLVRYDGVVPAGVIGIACVVKHFSMEQTYSFAVFKSLLPRYVLWGVMTLVPFIVVLLFRLIYYGDFVPHTAYEKFLIRSLDTRLLEGSVYVWNFLWSSKSLIVLAIIGILCALRAVRFSATSRLILALLVVLLLHCVYVGGDVAWKPYFRFGHLPMVLTVLLLATLLSTARTRVTVLVLPVVALLIAFVEAGARASETRKTPYTRVPIATYAFGRNAVLQDLSDKAMDGDAWRNALQSVTISCNDDTFSLTGKLLGQIAGSGDKLITSAAGKLVYFGGMPAIDTTSLASEQLWRKLSEEEKVRLAKTCTFASFHSNDGYRGGLLFPNTGLRPIAFIANTPHYHRILSAVFTTRDDLVLPESIPGSTVLKKFNLTVDGDEIVVYAEDLTEKQDVQWISDLYRKFKGKVMVKAG